MFLALQHSTYAAILDLIQYDFRHNYNLVARAMFLEAAVLLLSLFISEISPSNTRGKLRLVYCHCSCSSVEQDQDFRRGNTIVLCSGISVGWMFTSVCRGCCEAI